MPEGEHDRGVKVHVEGELGDDEEEDGEVREDEDEGAGAHGGDVRREENEAGGGERDQVGEEAKSLFESKTHERLSDALLGIFYFGRKDVTRLFIKAS